MFSARFLRSISKIQRPEEAKRFLRLDRYWRPEVIEPLIRRSDDVVAYQPALALELAQIAIELLKRMRKPGAELRAHALCALATAQREMGSLSSAELNFAKAEQLAGSGSKILSAMILRQKAVLLVEQGKLDPALEAARQAVSLDSSSGIFPDRSYIAEGIVLYFQRNYSESSRCFMEVLQRGNPSGNNYAFAMKNWVASIVHRPLLGSEIVEARQSLRIVLERIRGVRQTPVRYQIWHTEGHLHTILAEHREATNHFMQARTGFLRLGMIRDFARLSADLIGSLVKMGNGDRARTVIGRTAKTIAEFAEQEPLAAIFRSAQEQPVEEAAEFIRTRLDIPAAPNGESFK